MRITSNYMTEWLLLSTIFSLLKIIHLSFSHKLNAYIP